VAASAQIGTRAAGASLFGLLAALGCILPNYELLAVSQHLFLAVNVMALNFCLGLGGQVSLAQGAFCGLGAYISALLHPALPGASLAIAAIASGSTYALAAAVSRPLEKLGEGFLAMATLGVTLIFTNLILSLESLTGGTAGMMVDFKLALPIIGPISGDKPYYFLFLGLLLVSVLVFARVRSSRLGRALLACHDDPEAASACGVHRAAVRSLAFGLGGALSALAGMLQAHYSGFVSPGQYSLELSLKALLFLVIGGPGRILGPILAVLILETALSNIHFLGEARVLFHGLLLGLALLWGPVRTFHTGRGRFTNTAGTGT
jgi:branched-chain amino acid transport system permease protein